jgi:hypothetical protein
MAALMHEQVWKVGSSERPWNQVKRNNGGPSAMSFTSGMHYLAVAGTCSLLLEQTMVFSGPDRWDDRA